MEENSVFSQFLKPKNQLNTLRLNLRSFIFSQNCCEAEQEATNNCGGLGCYIPQCTDDCEWEPMQCNGTVPACWCVDSNGIMIDDTYTYPTWSEGYPNCESKIIA